MIQKVSSFVLFALVLWSHFTTGFGRFGHSDDCNWRYSSSVNDQGDQQNPGVMHVDLRCLKGVLEWNKPSGGLQVKFKTPVELLGSEFTVNLISQQGVAMYFEETENHGLKFLRGFETNDPRTSLSITSKNGTAALYLVIQSEEERQKISNMDSDVLRIDYELRPTEGITMAKDCKMCSVEKMADLFCNGEFAVKAKVENKYIDNDGEHVFMGLHVYHIFRQSKAIFSKSREGRYHIGTVRMLGKCSPPKGRHHYIFFGSMKDETEARDPETAFVACYLKFKLWRQLQNQIKCTHGKDERVEVPRDIREVFYSTEVQSFKDSSHVRG